MSHNNYILLVDDNEDDVSLTLRAIKKGPVSNHVTVTRDGQEALDYLFEEGEYTGKKHGLPVVVLLDLNMPRIGGLDVLKRLRSESRTKLLPVVILTTSDEQIDVINSYRLGANSYIRKPVDVEKFFQTIQELQKYWTLRNTSPSLIES